MRRNFLLICTTMLLIVAVFIFTGGGEKEKTITVVGLSGPYADAARLMAPRFEKENNVKITVVDLPYVGMFEKQLTELKSGAGTYDVIQGLYQWLGEYAPYCEPLDEWAKKSNTDLSDYPQQALNELGEWEGKIYIFPLPLETMMLFYRKDLIPNPPKTYAEFLSIAKRLNDPANDFYGTAVMGQREQAMTVFTDVLWGIGGELFDDNMKPIFNDAKGVKAMEILLEMLKYSPPESVTYAIPESVADFLSGRVAMIEQWPSTITFQAEDPDQSNVVGKVGYAPIPGGHGHFGGLGFSVAKSSKEKELAYKFVAFVTAKENAIEIMEETGVYPSHLSITKDPEVNKKYPFMEAFGEALEGTIGRPKIPESTQLCDILDMRVSQILAGTISVKEGLDKAAQEWEKILADAGYYN